MRPPDSQITHSVISNDEEFEWTIFRFPCARSLRRVHISDAASAFEVKFTDIRDALPLQHAMIRFDVAMKEFDTSRLDSSGQYTMWFLEWKFFS